MKGYFLPTILLIMVLLALAGGAWHSLEIRNTAVVTNEGAVDALKWARIAKESAEKNASKADTQLKPVDDFISEWRPFYRDYNNDSTGIFHTLDKTASDSSLVPSGKRSNPNMNYSFRGKTSSTFDVDISVSGEYAILVDWLGKVEHEYPIARIENLNITTQAQGPVMSVKLVFPMFAVFNNVVKEGKR